jgi:hypothetical protein
VASDYFPKNPSGYVPGAEFVDTGAPYGIKVGVITRVDPLELICDIKVVTGGGERFEVDLTQAMSGPRSFWGGIPEVNSYVIIGYRRKHKQLHEAVILGYIANGKTSGLRFDPVAPSDPSQIDPADASNYKKVIGSQIRYKRLKLSAGDVGGMSSAGSEFVLSTDIRMSNRAGDLFELRDADRTIVSQSIHRVEGESGILRMSGPARRSGFYLPPDILAGGRTLKTSEQGYFGGELLKRFTASEGVLFDAFNNADLYPPVTLANGRQVHYPSTLPATNFEDPKDGAGAEPYTECRVEMSHTTDMVQEVREEIDGFYMDRRPIYIERVMGTLIGNDSSSPTGLQQYGQLLRPKIFEDFQATGPAKFSTEAISRSPFDDSEAYTTAGAYLLRITPPANPAGSNDKVSAFAMAVSKQGKLFLNVPGSRVEKYSTGTKNVSAEINMEGALKARIGASKPDNIALHLTLEGGAVFDFRGGASGAGLQFRTHSSYVIEAQGVPDNNNLAYSEKLQGARESYTKANSSEIVEGSKGTHVSGGYSMLADRLSMNAHSGFGLNAGSIDVLSSGKSQYQYAQQVIETIVTGGKTTMILAGGVTETAAVGNWTTNVLGGSMSTTVAAGSYTVSIGTGSVSLSTATGAMTLSSAAGTVAISAGLAVSLTAGTTLNLTAPTSVTLTSAQVMVGGPAASLGVCRGAPMLPPGTPSLDYITGLPLQGAATFRSLL